MLSKKKDNTLIHPIHFLGPNLDSHVASTSDSSGVSFSLRVAMDELPNILSAAGVQETFIDKLQEDGWTAELFALAAPSLEKFDDQLPSILGDLDGIATAVQRSALRLAWTKCSKSHNPSGFGIVEAPQQVSAELPSSSSSWSETFPPKLTAAVVTDLKNRFRQNYPAEVLVAETTPSLRLLSLLHHQKTKKEFKWVPWKFRLSQAKAEEISSAKSSKLAKSEGIHLHALLVDTPPELTIENGSMGLHALRQTFETFSYAAAMVELAHLATLKQYFMRFLHLMTVKLDAETGLRNPTILEAQSADKALMTIVCELVTEKGWGFDDALHEVTFIRAEINTLLQARPKLPKQTFQRIEGNYPKGQGKHQGRPAPYPDRKGGKSSGKFGKGSKSGGKVSWVTEATVNGQKQQLCMRFQTGKCDLGSSCRFHHGCAYPLPSGEACNKQHGALMHDRTPH